MVSSMNKSINQCTRLNDPWDQCVRSGSADVDEELILFFLYRSVGATMCWGGCEI